MTPAQVGERSDGTEDGGAPLSPERAPGSVPRPHDREGTPDKSMPFDHIVVVMMENHSFDNLLGALPLHCRPDVDGLTFDGTGRPTNWNPGAPDTPGIVPSFGFTSTKQGRHVSQTWNATHAQINGGLMNGFVQSVGAIQPMGYYPPEVLPFAYSLARTFTVGNRWFASAPSATYPNRRFLLAGTAYGNISTSLGSLRDDPPPNGTIFDLLHRHKITWRDYFTDVPQTAIIPSIIKRYPRNHALLSSFFADCKTGRLPAVSFVDPDIGLLGALGSALAGLRAIGRARTRRTLLSSVGDAVRKGPTLKGLGLWLETLGNSEEAPEDMSYGEAWAHRVVDAVLRSPAWPRTLLIYTYDEHGGYYDHVPPPSALPPDRKPPALGPGDTPGGYDVYGPRVPAVVVSPHSKPQTATNVCHDHTSVLATIEAKWNLPALTCRDANAATVMDFVDVDVSAFADGQQLSRILRAQLDQRTMGEIGWA